MVFTALMSFVILIPEIANAYLMANILCAAYINVAQPVMRGLATLAVLALGIGALFGKVSWSLAVLVAVGAGAVFGAGEIATLVTGHGC